MMLPVFGVWQCLIETLIKVLVMREYDVAAMIDKLTRISIDIDANRSQLTKPSWVSSVAERPPALESCSKSAQDGPF